MATPTLAFSMGRNHKLFIAKTAPTPGTPTPDSGFIRLVNENDITLSYKADNEKIMTKDGGKVTIPQGDEDYTIKGTADCVFADPATLTLIGARNQAWEYQIRDLTVPASPVVFAEGVFVETDVEFKMAEKGVRQIGFTLENAGAVTLNIASGGRAVAS